MKQLTYLTCFALSCLAMGHSPERLQPIDGQDDCKEVEVKVTVTDAADGTHTARVEVLRGKVSGAKFIFFEDKKSGKLLNEGRYQKSTLEKLPAGKYFCVVANAADCSKKIYFTIE